MINYWLPLLQDEAPKIQIIMGKKKRIIKTGPGAPLKKELVDHEEVKVLDIDEQVKYSSI